MTDLFRRSPKSRSECPTCGARSEEVSPGEAIWGSSTYYLKGKHHPCFCAQQLFLYEHYLLSRIPEEYMRLTEDDYYGDTDAMKEAIAYVNNWKNYRNHGMGIGFYSKVQGTGKTMLATFIGRKLIMQGESVYYTYFGDVISTYKLPPEERMAEDARLHDCTVLILDEIMKPVSDPQRDLFGERFEALIRYRSNYGKPTILTTNLTTEELEEEYPRTYSILAAKEQSITVNGSDARRQGIWDINKALAENGEMRPIT